MLPNGATKECHLAQQPGGLALPVIAYVPWLKRYRPVRGEQVAEKMLRVSQQPGKPLQYFRLDDIFRD